MDAFSCDISPTSSGDYDSAMDVLKMAITLIKQSVTAGTEASQVSVVKDVHVIHDAVVQHDLVFTGTSSICLLLLWFSSDFDPFSPRLCSWD